MPRRYTRSRDGKERTTVRAEVRLDREQWEMLEEMAKECECAPEEIVKNYAAGFYFWMHDAYRTMKGETDNSETP